MTYSDAIIKRLTEICAERHITINRLATLSGITQSTIEDLMAGKTKNPKLITLHKIAIGLNMTVAELLDFKELNECVFDDE
ncbi:MAG TPA: helix-turn-helix transcriptional regulator [Candidatus Onthovicinus excrementipullorum]|nr:helix-turn-helix transcriptional regulator [Candidatus Onthovicinus excrementipullorum]